MFDEMKKEMDFNNPSEVESQRKEMDFDANKKPIQQGSPERKVGDKVRIDKEFGDNSRELEITKVKDGLKGISVKDAGRDGIEYQVDKSQLEGYKPNNYVNSPYGSKWKQPKQSPEQKLMGVKSVRDEVIDDTLKGTKVNKDIVKKAADAEYDSKDEDSIWAAFERNEIDENKRNQLLQERTKGIVDDVTDDELKEELVDNKYYYENARNEEEVAKWLSDRLKISPERATAFVKANYKGGAIWNEGKTYEQFDEYEDDIRAKAKEISDSMKSIGYYNLNNEDQLEQAYQDLAYDLKQEFPMVDPKEIEEYVAEEGINLY